MTTSWIARAGAALLFALATSAPVIATIPPLTPEGEAMLTRKDALLNALLSSVGHAVSSDMRNSYASVLVGREKGSKAALSRAVYKDETGWFELRGTRSLKLPPGVARELDRLLLQQTLWSQQPYAKVQACRSARLFIIRRAGRELFGRQCKSFGSAGQIARLASSLHPVRRPITSRTYMPIDDTTRKNEVTADAHRQIAERTGEVIRSWQTGSLAGAIDPYADDVVVELPDRTLLGRSAFAAWLRLQQSWSPPGVEGSRTEPRYRYHRGDMKPPEGGYILERREVRWETNGVQMRRTYSATWRERGGLWEIVRERVSADQPATGVGETW